MSLGPAENEIYNERGSAYDELNMYEEALSDYAKCIELNPKSPLGYYNRGLMLYKQKIFRLAIEDFSKVIELNPYFDSEAYGYRAKSYEELKMYDKAKEDNLTFEKLSKKKK